MLLTHSIQQLTSFRGVVGLSRRERERDGRSSIRENHMNLGGPIATRLADGLGTVFFNAPALLNRRPPLARLSPTSSTGSATTTI